MKNIIILLCCYLSLQVTAQETSATDSLNLSTTDSLDYIPYPQGCYMSLEEILNKTPSRKMDIEMVKRTKKDIQYTGGNDFMLVAPNKKIKKRVLKKDIWAVSDGVDLFLNGYRMGIFTWYAKVEEYGPHLIFRAAGPPVKVDAAALILGGAIGGAIAGAKAATIRYIYIFNTETGKVRRAIKKTMPSILADYPDLLAAFEAEEDKYSIEVLKSYMQQLNKRLYIVKQ